MLAQRAAASVRVVGVRRVFVKHFLWVAVHRGVPIRAKARIAHGLQVFRLAHYFVVGIFVCVLCLLKRRNRFVLACGEKVLLTR